MVNLSNGSYRYPSSVKAEILKKNGETWETYKKDVTGKVTFTDSGEYKIKYSAEGMTAETEEFKVYKPGEIYEFKANKSAYLEGTEMQLNDFSVTYCYKTEDGNIGITSSLDKAYDICFYTVNEEGGKYSLSGTENNKYVYDEKMDAGVIILFDKDGDLWAMEEIKGIKILRQEDCNDIYIKNLAYFSKLKSAKNYEFSGSIYRVFYDEGSPIGKVNIIKKTDSGVEINGDYTVKISDFIKSDLLKSDHEGIQGLYNRVTDWNEIKTETFNENTLTSQITGPGYFMVQIFKGKDEITKDDPAFIRVSK